MLMHIFFITDPQQWTPAQVQSWLHSTITQYKLPVSQNLSRLFSEDGAALSRLTDEDFTSRIPQVCYLYIFFVVIFFKFSSNSIYILSVYIIHLIISL